MLNNSKVLRVVFLLFFMSMTGYSHASVVINNNRIIYPSSTSERTIQFTNDDNSPYMIQVWTDMNNTNSTTETADGPFINSPPLFKMLPHSSQMIRLQYIGDSNLPRDRESLFYFNFLQIPPLKQQSSDKNKLAILVTNRLKIFYRPEELSDSPETIDDKLIFTYKNRKLEVINNSAYHANFTNATIVDKSGKVIMTIPNTQMVAPKSKQNWTLSNSLNNQELLINYGLVNDYGYTERHQRILHY